jgi:tyrosine-protein phosphatase SIW14
MSATGSPAPLLVLIGLLSPAWAGDIQVPGIPNFHKVNERLYRGGQPPEDAWNRLARLGIKTVIDLRREEEQSREAESRAVEAAGMRYINVPMNGGPPREVDILEIFGILDSREPVFVHCREGKDRTGTVVACYRIATDGWENRKALAEAKSLGMHWFQPGMKSYILGFRDVQDGQGHLAVDSGKAVIRP